MAVKTYKKDSTAKLSEYFSVYEFRCGLGRGCSCATTLIDDKLVEILQQIREHFGKPVTVTSGYRCPTYNKSVNGATASRHAKGQAADIVVAGVKPAEVAKYAESIGVLGVGLYETDKDGHFVHVDTRTTKAFWYGQAQEKRTTFGGAAATPEPDTCSVKLPVLKKGHKGDHVEALQILLIGRGYRCGKKGADGDFGSATGQALRKYKAAKKLTANDTADAATWASLLGL
jgi:hypothetical protein